MSQITTHVLDTALGKPAAGIHIILHQRDARDWTQLACGISNNDGRVSGLLDDNIVLAAGDYRMHFATAAYFAEQQLEVFYPYVDVVFRLNSSGDHYHIPLLLSPFAYSTYRGS